ncbi:MAG: hypothetical protein ACTHW2_11405 [Tissierella sp.]|uniref:hypothetical protein n=1 Tax=Tissierella sp. TaxID=41274 RepID=UPI003F9A49E6
MTANKLIFNSIENLKNLITNNLIKNTDTIVEATSGNTGIKVESHRIQGVSDEFIPEIVKLDSLDEIISVDDGDSIVMAQKLASDLGLGVGISSGAIFFNLYLFIFYIYCTIY